MKFKKLSAALAAIAVLFFTGCVKTDSPVVMSYGGCEITADMYSYWMSTYKGYYVYEYSDVEDSDEYWQSDVGGMTADEVVTDMVKENVEMTLVCMKLYDDLGLTIPDVFYDNLDAYVSDLIDTYADGSKSMFNLALSEYGVNEKIFRKIVTEEQKTSLVFDYMYGENGTETVTDEQRDAFYKNTYSRVSQIFINNAYVYEYDENGDYVYDDDGNIVRDAMEGEQLEAANAKVEAVRNGIDTGDDFDTLYEKYSEEKSYPNGYYVYVGMDFIDEVVNAAISMKPGEILEVKSDYGVHFLKCMELDDKAWENEDNADFFEDFEAQTTDYLFRQFVKSHIEDISVNEEEISKFKISEVTPNYSFS